MQPMPFIFLAPFCLQFVNYKYVFPLNYCQVQTLLCSPDLYIFLNYILKDCGAYGES